MEYRCISADCHIDLNWLPYDLFVSNASPTMKDRMPYVVQETDGPRWRTKAGVDLGLANGKGSKGVTSSSGKAYLPGKDYRLDRMATTGLYEDGSKGIFRPTTPELRLQDQERDGIQAEVIYGVLGSGNRLKDHEAAIEFYRIYNDWLANFCSYDRKRFIGLASIPSHDVEAAVAATREVSKLGLGGLDFHVAHDMTPLWEPYWDPFWKIAAETDMPVHFHSIGTPPTAPLRPNIPESLKEANRAAWLAGFQSYLATLLAAIICGGALERFPNLRIVLGESGIGWIPYVLDRLDVSYNRFKNLPLKMKPSDYWRRQCRATFQNDRIGTKLLDDMGVENVMWSSDYPHSDGVFPDSQEHIKRQFGHLPNTIQHKVICENASKFYGLM